MTTTKIIKTITASAFAAALGGLIALPLPATAQMTAPKETAKEAAKPKRAPTAGQLAARERQKKCAAEWKTEKAAGKVDKAMTWPKYWSACNKRLKAV